jgi:hypothetical protein
MPAPVQASTSVQAKVDAADASTPLTGPITAPTEAADEETAMALAGRFRSPVEVLSKRTESAQTFAQPDGSFRFVQAASPQRVRRGSGWVPVDPTLKLSDGLVVPQAAVLNLQFSGGGSAPMVAIAKGEKSLSLSWPGQLPVPSLDGDTATYAEVLPGVDLRLTAAVDSYSQVLVVKTLDAAKNPALARLPFGLSTRGVSVEQDADSGFLRAVDSAGEAVFVSDGARMWDSPEPQQAKAMERSAAKALTESVPADEPQPARAENVPVQLSSQALTVVPSADMLTSPNTNFPVYIDPGFNGGTEIWTPVSRNHPNTSYWSGNGYRDYMRVGQLYEGASDDDWRTLVKFDITKLKSTQIRSAAVHVNVWHSANCVASPMQLWRTNAISKSSAVTWNSTKGKSWKRLAERKATANKSFCPKGNDEIKFSQTAVKQAFQSAATAKYPSITFAFRAKSEGDGLQWKKLKAGSSYLDIVYNHPPGKPSGLSFKPCDEACASPAVTSNSKPTLTMKAADADGGSLRYDFRVVNAAKTKQVSASGNAVTKVKSGASRPWRLPKALPDGQYYWRGRACDSYKCGPYSGYFNFKVDSTNPKLPKVTSTDYPKSGWNGGPGDVGEFTLAAGSAADGVTEFSYALNGGKAKVAIPDSKGDNKGKATVKLAPKDMKNALSVSALDLAGNRSGTMTYEFRVKPEGNSWYWSLDEGTGTTAASEPLNDRPMALSGSGVTWSDSAMADSEGSASFAGTGELTTTLPVVNTTAVAGLTVAGWVRLPAPDAEDSPEDETEVPDPGEDEDDPTVGGDDPDSEDSPSDEEDNSQEPQVPDKNQSAVSADGSKRSMFRLGYRNDLNVDQDAAGTADPAWCFSLAAADTATAKETTACTTQYVTPGDWVHLVGVADPMNNQIRLYVNGTPAIDGALTPVEGKALWEATGRFAIGRALASGTASERWVGDLDEIYVVPRVWTSEEIDFKAFVP